MTTFFYVAVDMKILLDQHNVAIFVCKAFKEQNEKIIDDENV